MTNATKSKSFTAETAKALHERAFAAGMAAGEAVGVVPMFVGSPPKDRPLSSEVDFTQKVWFVEGGVCGFASVRFPGNTSYARAAVKNGFATKSYTGGVYFWVRPFGQSMQRKEAFAYAYAAVLREAGVQAYGESRMD